MKNFKRSFAVVCDPPAAPSVQNFLRDGLLHHQSGRWIEAANAYGRALGQNPNDAKAHHLLGLVSLQLSDLPKAIDSFSRAIQIDPVHTESHFNLANAYLRAGVVQKAIEGYQATIGLDPEHLAGRFNLAHALASLGHHAEAVELYRAVSRQSPNFPGLWINLGVSLVSLGESRLAADAFRESAVRQPDLAQAWNNLGCVLGEIDELDEAVSALCRAVALSPGNVEALLNLSRALHRTGSLDCIEIAQKAVEISPKSAEAWAALADGQLLFGKSNDARISYERAIAIDPNAIQKGTNLGMAYLQSSHLDEAELFYHRYLGENPSDTFAWGDLALTQATGGALEASLKSFRKALEVQPKSPEIHSNLLVIMSYGQEATPSAMHSEARQWAKLNVPEGPLFPPHPTRNHSKLRVGYVSGDYRSHPVGRFVDDIFQAHDQSRFECYAYSNCKNNDSVTKSIRSHVEHWREVHGLSDEALAAQIREDEIDILIDLTGHTPMHRLAAFGKRMAPVQATWLGYFGTTGLEEMDFILSDDILLPPSEEAFYTERPARMPNGLYFLQIPKVSIQPSKLPLLENGYATFGCFNMVTKISPETVALWSKVLQSQPNSRMVLNRHAFAAEGTRERYFDLFAQHGIERNRIDLNFTQTREQYFRAYQEVDIMLDTLPFSGGTTSSEALWMGIPVISLSSDRFPGRMTESIMRTVGIDDLTPRDEADFVRLASELVSDIPRLTDLRASLRSKIEGSRLCDVNAYTRELESVLEWMWDQRS